jgi:hypothetical protein
MNFIIRGISTDMIVNVKQGNRRAQKSIADDDVAMPRKRAGRTRSVASVKHHPWCL